MRWIAAVLMMFAGVARAEVPKVIGVRAARVGTSAQMTARFSLEVAGPISHQRAAAFALPIGAVVTGATVAGHALALREAPAATQAFEDAITGPDRGTPRWVALIDQGEHEVRLSLGAPRSATITVELEVSVPTCYAGGARFANVPADWVPAAAPAQRASKRDGARASEACSISGDGTGWLRLGTARAPIAPPFADGLSAFAGRLALGDANVARVELDLAAQLGEVPRDLATVVLVDASRSMTERRLDAQRELVAAYLRAAPRGRVQVIACARTATALLPAWTVASVAAPRVDRELRALATKNGSNVDAGLAEAAAWLSRATGTRRVIVVTDELLPQRLVDAKLAALAALLPAGTLVHVVAAEENAVGPRRDDSVMLADLAAETLGIGARTGLPDAPMDATVLARPTSLDAVKITAPGWAPLALGLVACGDADGALPEGLACTWWGRGEGIAGPIAVEGKLWGRTVTRVLAPSRAPALEIARELLGNGSITSEPMRAQLAAAARAVSDGWSLFAAWGGSAGYREGAAEGGTYTSTISDASSADVIDRVRGTSGAKQTVAEQFQGLSLACPMTGAHARIDLELTWLEIVDVKVTLRGGDPALKACLEEAIWATALSLASATSRAHATFDL